MIPYFFIFLQRVEVLMFSRLAVCCRFPFVWRRARRILSRSEPGKMCIRDRYLNGSLRMEVWILSGGRVSNAWATCPIPGDNSQKWLLIPHKRTAPHGAV